MRSAHPAPPTGLQLAQLSRPVPTARDILKDALAAAALIGSAAAVGQLETWAFGDGTPWLVAAMLFVGELALAFGFVSALLSALRKTKLLSEELGFGRLLRALWALRIDHALWSAAGAVFRDAALTGALLGALCGGLALMIVLVADASQQTKERWFFYGLYAVVSGVVGVLAFAPVDRRIMANMRESGCGFVALFLLIFVGGLSIWLALGLGHLERHFGPLRALACWLLPQALHP